VRGLEEKGPDSVVEGTETVHHSGRKGATRSGHEGTRPLVVRREIVQEEKGTIREKGYDRAPEIEKSNKRGKKRVRKVNQEDMPC